MKLSELRYRYARRQSLTKAVETLAGLLDNGDEAGPQGKYEGCVPLSGR